MTAPILGPADDEVAFFQPRGQVFVTMLWVTAIGWAACNGLFVLIALAFGAPMDARYIVTIAESLLIVPFVTAALCLLVAWNRLGWLHSSMHHLDFAATGRRGVRIEWHDVAMVGLRRRGVFTELMVHPAAMDRVTVLPGTGRKPRVVGDALVVDVGLMSPGPATLLAELHRRIPSKV